jgi:ribosome-interacting GTPase 1
LDDFIIAYLNDIIIYLNSVEEHKEHIKWVLKKLYKENILVTVKKYKFHTKKTNFVGFIIKLKQISIDLKSVTKLRLFLGFYNYY